MLPKIAAPTFELTQPSTGKTIQYRPFLVKEEKSLLIARESGERKDVFNAVKQIINACVMTEGFDVNQIPLFDMEYIFINLRAKSVNNIVEFQVEDSTDGKTYDLSVDLDEVQVVFPEGHDNKVQISDKIGLVMKHPTPEISDKIANLETVAEITYQTMLSCIDYVYDEEETYPWAQSSDKERKEFLDNLPIEAYNKIQKFFETVPKIEHIVTYENSEGVEKKVVFRNLEDFFTLY